MHVLSWVFLNVTEIAVAIVLAVSNGLNFLCWKIWPTRFAPPSSQEIDQMIEAARRSLCLLGLGVILLALWSVSWF